MIFSRDLRGRKLSGIFLLPRRRGTKHALNGITINEKQVATFSRGEGESKAGAK